MAAAPAVARTPTGYLSGPARLQGVDLARGFAVLGMLAAHLVTLPTWRWDDPATWGDIVNGRSSILFATLAGVSIALVSGGAVPLSPGRALRRVRASLAVRAVLLWAVGLALIATGVPVYVILPAYGVLFLLALPLLRLRAPALWALAAALALVMPWVQPVLDALPLWAGDTGRDVSNAVGWHYPVTVWIAFVVAGLAAGRSDLAAARTPPVLLGAGASLALIGYGTDAAVTASGAVPTGGYLSEVLAGEAHSSGLLEVIGSGGFALASLAVCLLLCRVRAAAAVSLPLRAVGAMPLTAYVGQIVAWALVAAAVLGDTGDLLGMRDLSPFWPFALGTIAFCTAWALLVGRGPLEWVFARVARLATRRVA
ncbi:heparan-alpha-glucosaminide N-acetyltransferase domain-containing protein [Microbacterium sp. bgisy203]|uniref:heparan-alpha-glucosaminide N-acetyltransferase domain-containing protein n=1 Tax=Microbacterium sp. bgisy203 TaxID=3413799 RepID=UPI003D7199FE